MMRYFKPIQMSPNMVAAILAGNKRRTRRIMKPQPVLDKQGHTHGGFYRWPVNPRNLATGRYTAWSHEINVVIPGPGDNIYNQCPYPPGTLLWVREKWAVAKDYDHLKPCDFSNTYPEGIHQIYWWITDKVTGYGNRGRWRSALHLPKTFARIILEVKSVTATRLQTITPEQAIEGGIEYVGDLLGEKYYGNYGDEEIGDKLDPVESYRTLWNSLHGHQSWDKNPWVWDIEFDVLAPTKYGELKANTEIKKARILHEEIV